MVRGLRFALFFLGVCLLFATAILAYPAGPAYEQSLTHVETLDEVPDDNPAVVPYEALHSRQQSYVDRAVDGERVEIPAYRDLPPDVVYHRNRSVVYRFESDHYYDPGRTAGQGGIAAGLIGIAALGFAFWMDPD